MLRLFPLIAGGIGVLYAIIIIRKILRQSPGSGKMTEIAAAIETGAKAYLKRQYQTVAFLAVAIIAVLLIFLGLPTAIGFLVGAVLSASAGIIGMLISRGR